MIEMLAVNGIRAGDILIVFDGDALPNKEETNRIRSESRHRHLEIAKQLELEGNMAQAIIHYQRSVSIKPELVNEVIKLLDRENISYIISPFEADAQLAYLSLNDFVDVVISEDSDTLVYGCKKVIFKLDRSGKCDLIKRSDLGTNRQLDFSNWSDDQFKLFCCLSGCDYFQLKGIGIKTAYKIVHSQKSTKKVLQYLYDHSYIKDNEVAGLLQSAVHIFKHQIIMDPITLERKPLTDIPSTFQSYLIENGTIKSISSQSPDFITTYPLNVINSKNSQTGTAQDPKMPSMSTSALNDQRNQTPQLTQLQSNSSEKELFGFQFPATSSASQRVPHSINRHNNATVWTSPVDEGGDIRHHNKRHARDLPSFNASSAYTSQLIAKDYKTLYRRQKERSQITNRLSQSASNSEALYHNNYNNEFTSQSSSGIPPVLSLSTEELPNELNNHIIIKEKESVEKKGGHKRQFFDMDENICGTLSTLNHHSSLVENDLFTEQPVEVIEDTHEDCLTDFNRYFSQLPDTPLHVNNIPHHGSYLFSEENSGIDDDDHSSSVYHGNQSSCDSQSYQYWNRLLNSDDFLISNENDPPNMNNYNYNTYTLNDWDFRSFHDKHSTGLDLFQDQPVHL
mmetsp:Transcript_15948/g.23302  ORF Transcript_15948/g.23302 Transcript_15948/m.23302 type:complete len:623 (+) Transcript_15948:151-2019(+)